jgi:putative peptidoglycan lipid II flippase
MGPLSTVGLAIASNVAVVVQAWYLQVKLAKKQPALAFHHIARDTGKVLVASLVMGAVVAAGWWGWRHVFPPSSLLNALALAVLIGVGVVVYAGLVWVLKIEGREDIVGMMNRRFNRKEAGVI